MQALQGRFKRPVKASSLCMGQELLKGNDNVSQRGAGRRGAG